MADFCEGKREGAICEGEIRAREREEGRREAHLLVVLDVGGSSGAAAACRTQRSGEDEGDRAQRRKRRSSGGSRGSRAAEGYGWIDGGIGWI